MKNASKVFPLQSANVIWAYIKENADIPLNGFGRYTITLEVQDDNPVYVEMGGIAKFKVQDVR